MHDKNVSLFPTAVAEFKMSRLTLPRKKLVIEFIIQVKIVGFNLIKILVQLFFGTEGNSVTDGEQFSLW